MTQDLERAFAEASKLPAAEQDAFARWILTELAAEHSWHDLLSRAPDRLAGLGREALPEHHQGQTQPLDPDRL